jgi:hypothetical protein
MSNRKTILVVDADVAQREFAARLVLTIAARRLPIRLDNAPPQVGR